MMPETPRNGVRFAAISVMFWRGRLVHTGGVTGSIPVSPTIQINHLEDVNEAPSGYCEHEGAMTMTIDDLSEAEMKHIAGYYGRRSLKRREVTTEVFCEYADTTWTLADFMADIADAAAKVPAGVNATVELEGGYEETTKFRIFYDAPESDADYTKRIAEIKAWAKRTVADQEVEQRRVYEALKAKFG